MNQKSLFSALLMVVILFIAACSTETPDGQKPESSFCKSTRVLNLTPEYFTLSGIEEAADFQKGSKITLTLTPGEYLNQSFSKVHMEHIHIHVNDKVYMPTFEGGDDETCGQLSVEIEVPSEDFEVIACYSVQQQFSDNGYTMTLDSTEPVRLFGVSPEKRYKYFDCYLLAEDAYVISNVQFKVGDGEWQNINEVTGCSFAKSYNGIENLYTVTVRPEYEDVTGDVTLRVEGEQLGRYAITWENADENYLDMTKSVFPATAIEGETVTAEIYLKPDYYLKSAETSVAGLDLSIVGESYVKFTMPAEDVTVNLNVQEKIPLNCIASTHITQMEFYDANDMYYGVPVTKGVPGRKAYLFASVEEGYKPSAAKLTTGESFGFSFYLPGIYMSEIQIPEDAARVDASVETAKGYRILCGDNVVFNDGDVYAEGETVSMAVYVPDGQKIKSITVKETNGKAVDVSTNLPYASFVMPASDVEVAVEYAPLDSKETVSVIAYFDSDIYEIYSSTNYDWNFAKGFEVEKGKTFYVSVSNYEGGMYYVGVKIGSEVTVYPAQFDDMMGEYSFGKSLVANDDITIKVGATEDSVAF